MRLRTLYAGFRSWVVRKKINLPLWSPSRATYARGAIPFRALVSPASPERCSPDHPHGPPLANACAVSCIPSEYLLKRTQRNECMKMSVIGHTTAGRPSFGGAGFLYRASLAWPTSFPSLDEASKHRKIYETFGSIHPTSPLTAHRNKSTKQMAFENGEYAFPACWLGGGNVFAVRPFR